MKHTASLLATSLFVFALTACGGKYVGTGEGTGFDEPDRTPGSGSGGDGGFDPDVPGGFGASPGEPGGVAGGVSVGGGVGIGGGVSVGGGVGVSGPLTGCTLVGEYNDQGFCEQQRACDNGYSFTYCEGDHCFCDSPAGHIEVPAIASDGGSLCSAAHDGCMEFMAQAPSTPLTCSPGYQDQGYGYCSMSEECTRTVPLMNGDAAQFLWRESWCEGSSCECYSDSAQGSARIEFSREIQGIDDCKSALEVCSSDSVLSPSGTTCEPRYQSADRNWCDVELECSHPSTIGGEAVNVFNYQHANCQRGSGDSWDCWCQGSTLNIESSTGWDACSQLADICTL